MSVTTSAWLKLETMLAREPKIDSTRNTAQNLQNLYESGLSVILLHQDQPIGFIAAWPVEGDFYEIGSVWIACEHRGNGLSRLLYNAIVALPKIQQGTAFAITTNPLAVRAGKRVGLTLMDDWQDPVPFHLTCGPCENVAPKDQPTCKYRNTSCWLRILR